MLIPKKGRTERFTCMHSPIVERQAEGQGQAAEPCTKAPARRTNKLTQGALATVSMPQFQSNPVHCNKPDLQNATRCPKAKSKRGAVTQLRASRVVTTRLHTQSLPREQCQVYASDVIVILKLF